jgi:SNF2 family DNA or RNA helicase
MAHAFIGPAFTKPHDYIWVRTAWEERDLIKLVPGSRWDPDERCWKVPFAWSSCVMLRGVFGDGLSVDDWLIKQAWEWRRFSDQMLDLRDRTELPPDLNDEMLANYQRLRNFQRVGSVFFTLAECGILGDEMGLGKTPQALSALRDLHMKNKPVLSTLVICPNSAKTSVWKEHALDWFPECYPVVIEGGVVNKRRLLDGPGQRDDALVIINFEALRLHSRLAPYGSTRLASCSSCKHGRPSDVGERYCETHPRELNRIPFRTVIVDEAHRILDPKSKQTRATWAIGHGPTVVNRWPMTGTITRNAPDDAWSLLHFIDPIGFPSKTKFVDRYCLMAWNAQGGLDVAGLNPQTRDEFFALWKPRFRRMVKSLVATQLPPKVYETRAVDLTPAQRKMYKALETEYVAIDANGEPIVASSNFAAQTRLLQLSSASLEVEYGDDPADLAGWKVTLKEPAPKLDALMEVLEELGDRQCVVAAEHRQLIELAARRLAKHKISHALITGAVKQWDRDDALKNFQAGRVRVLLFTLKAGGTGLTMTAADTIIFLQRSWSIVDNKQGEDRVHRIGSERHETVTVVDIVARDTVEQAQLARLHHKFKVLQELSQDRALLLKNGGDTTQLDAEEARLMTQYLGVPS